MLLWSTSSIYCIITLHAFISLLLVPLQRDNLKQMFSPFGNVIGVSVMPNKKSGYVAITTKKYNASDIIDILCMR